MGAELTSRPVHPRRLYRGHGRDLPVSPPLLKGRGPALVEMQGRRHYFVSALRLPWSKCRACGMQPISVVYCTGLSFTLASALLHLVCTSTTRVLEVDTPG